MSDWEVTRWQHNRIYPQLADTHKSLRVHKRFDLIFTNFPIVYNFKIVYATLMNLVALIFCDKCGKQATLTMVMLWYNYEIFDKTKYCLVEFSFKGYSKCVFDFKVQSDSCHPEWPVCNVTIIKI